MPQQVQSSTENNFTKGLITEATGLNFPENAATDTANCVYTLVGDVARRLGINTEVNGTVFMYDRHDKGMSQFMWNTAGGDGENRYSVLQIGQNLYFFNVSTATDTQPLSVQQSINIIDISQFTVQGQAFDLTLECQYASGNGYLFVFHQSIDPVYISLVSTNVFLANRITVQIRDFVGVADGFAVNFRPTVAQGDHLYNLQNQGWLSASPWVATSSSSNVAAIGSISWTVASGITGISNGQTVNVTGIGIGGGTVNASMAGTVTSYSGTTLTLSINTITSGQGNTYSNWTFAPINQGYINTWVGAIGNYPSNADVWWYYKNSSDVFAPATTFNNVTFATGNAPRGHYILNAFNEDRATVSTIVGVTPVTTIKRPTTGAWFQGRVWYSGVDAAQPATGDAKYYTWSSNIYFSQIVNSADDFGSCYQVNDPTSENLNALLPSDGGVITIPDSGNIHKLWPIANGMLVFADNGVWFITGSQGIGFTADDYEVSNISYVKTFSATSFVNVLGLPYFWNEEGIYHVSPVQGGQLTVEPITVGTILSYYNNIPVDSRRFARGDYNPIEYTIQWAFKSTQENSILDRYDFDTILNYNTYNKAFFPYTISTNTNNQRIHGVQYVSYPTIGSTTPDPGFKYPMSYLFFPSYNISFADEHDTTYTDWAGTNYISYLVTGYKVHGQGQKRFQVPYIYVFLRTDNPYSAYTIQSRRDYATTSDSGQWGTEQFAEIFDANRGFAFKRHRVRSRGLVTQFKISSVDGQPFDIIGWSMYDNVNTGV